MVFIRILLATRQALRLALSPRANAAAVVVEAAAAEDLRVDVEDAEVAEVAMAASAIILRPDAVARKGVAQAE